MAAKTGFDALMHQVCVGWGHCGSVQAGKYVYLTDFMPDTGSVAATQFAEWVRIAEGEADAPLTYRERWFSRSRGSVIEHMGADRVDAWRTRWQSNWAAQAPRSGQFEFASSRPSFADRGFSFGQYKDPVKVADHGRLLLLFAKRLPADAKPSWNLQNLVRSSVTLRRLVLRAEFGFTHRFRLPRL